MNRVKGIKDTYNFNLRKINKINYYIQSRTKFDVHSPRALLRCHIAYKYVFMLIRMLKYIHNRGYVCEYCVKFIQKRITKFLFSFIGIIILDSSDGG